MASELQKKKMFIENQYAHFSLQCEVMEKMGEKLLLGEDLIVKSILFILVS